MACLSQAPGLVFSRQLGRHENNRLLHPVGRKDGIQQTVLVIKIIGVMDHLSQQGTVNTLGQFDPLGILRQTTGHWRNAAIERCRKQEGLTVGRQTCRNEVNVFDEAHIEHAVGFIQNQRHHA